MEILGWITIAVILFGAAIFIFRAMSLFFAGGNVALDNDNIFSNYRENRRIYLGALVIFLLLGIILTKTTPVVLLLIGVTPFVLGLVYERVNSLRTIGICVGLVGLLLMIPISHAYIYSTLDWADKKALAVQGKLACPANDLRDASAVHQLVSGEPKQVVVYEDRWSEALQYDGVGVVFEYDTSFSLCIQAESWDGKLSDYYYWPKHKLPPGADNQIIVGAIRVRFASPQGVKLVKVRFR